MYDLECVKMSFTFSLTQAFTVNQSLSFRPFTAFTWLSTLILMIIMKISDKTDKHITSTPPVLLLYNFFCNRNPFSSQFLFYFSVTETFSKPHYVTTRQVAGWLYSPKKDRIFTHSIFFFDKILQFRLHKHIYSCTTKIKYIVC